MSDTSMWMEKWNFVNPGRENRMLLKNPDTAAFFLVIQFPLPGSSSNLTKM